MTQHFSSLSEQELSSLLAKAVHELDARREAKKKAVMAEIVELAHSIGAEVTFQETKTRRSSGKRGTVPIKYRDPEYPEHAWSGRGVKPRWLVTLLNQGRAIEEFRV